MKVDGEHYRTIWIAADDPATVLAIDQHKLPHEFEIMRLCAVDDFVAAIKDMRVRGAGLIGAAAGYGMYIAALTAPQDRAQFMFVAAEKLLATRPTAVNLAWAVKRQLRATEKCVARDDAVRAALRTAEAIADEDAESCRRIGLHGKELIIKAAEKKRGGTVNILTHCNAGWLAFVDHGSALSPVYAAFDEGIKTHVWVDETRPRNQGAALTCWELGRHGVPHTLVADNAGGHLMQHGMVDLVLVGADRVARNGDAANKIGTYLKALAAKDNGVPFYVALPSSSFDLEMDSGLANVPIEERDASEVCFVSGKGSEGKVTTVQICPDGTQARNWGFDVTPARLIDGLICERGICAASEKEINNMLKDVV
ncbi:MAG: S-methyl-5-thioribose-1-phosphate isomerase [Kiritimatiellae bacterium]|nr:S-methyl-5-thioribose-1-phosphate isomerase [Kiritimatiellia bacterium]